MFIQPHAHPESFFGGLCLDLGVTSALPMPIGQSILGKIPRRASNSFRTNYAIVSGITDEADGPLAADSCDAPAAKAGLMKLCVFGTNYGCYSMESQIVDIKGVGMKFDECEIAPVRMVGNPFAIDAENRNTGLMPMEGVINGNDIDLSNPSVKFRLELWASYIRRFAPDFYTGDGTVIDARDRRVFGWEGLINVGYQDLSVPSAPVPCPRADSYVLDWGAILGGDICANPTIFYQALLNLYLTAKDRANTFGFNMPMWAFSMPAGLFSLLTYILPCVMATYKCGGTGTPNAAANINVNNVDVGQEMRMGSFLWLDGDRVPVCQDPFVPVDKTGAPLLVADIFLFPVNIAGLGNPTFIDYFDFNNTLGLGATGINEMIANAEDYIVVDNGRALILKNPMNHGCRTVELITCPRPMELTPQIAGRILDVEYTPIFSQTAWDPNDTGFVDGGSPFQTATILPYPTV